MKTKHNRDGDSEGALLLWLSLFAETVSHERRQTCWRNNTLFYATEYWHEGCAVPDMSNFPACILSLFLLKTSFSGNGHRRCHPVKMSPLIFFCQLVMQFSVKVKIRIWICRNLESFWQLHCEYVQVLRWTWPNACNSYFRKKHQFWSIFKRKSKYLVSMWYVQITYALKFGCRYYMDICYKEQLVVNKYQITPTPHISEYIYIYLWEYKYYGKFP